MRSLLYLAIMATITSLPGATIASVAPGVLPYDIDLAEVGVDTPPRVPSRPSTFA